MINKYNIKTILYTNNMFNTFKKDYLKNLKIKCKNENFLEKIELFGLKLMLMKLIFNPNLIQLIHKLKNKNSTKEHRIIRIYGTFGFDIIIIKYKY